MIVLDSSFLYALLDGRDDHHAEAAGWFADVHDELATTPLVLAEVDYMVGSRIGDGPRTMFRQDLAAGAYFVDWWPQAPRESVEIAERYRGLGLSLTDASLMALAARLETTMMATFDERHFRAVQPVSGERAYTLLPVDAG